jgi:hypothetical protein
VQITERKLRIWRPEDAKTEGEIEVAKQLINNEQYGIPEVVAERTLLRAGFSQPLLATAFRVTLEHKLKEAATYEDMNKIIREAMLTMTLQAKHNPIPQAQPGIKLKIPPMQLGYVVQIPTPAEVRRVAVLN